MNTNFARKFRDFENRTPVQNTVTAEQLAAVYGPVAELTLPELDDSVASELKVE